MGQEIESLMVHNESTFAASGNKVGRFVRGKLVAHFVTNGFLDPRRDDSDRSSSSSSSSDTESEEDEEDEERDDEREILSELVLFGNTLVALSKERRRMYVWDVPPYANPASKDPLVVAAAARDDDSDDNDDGRVTPYAVLEFPTRFTPTKVVHPASYLNKVVVASKEGQLAVWNVRTGYVHPPPRFVSSSVSYAETDGFHHDSACIHTFDLSTILPSSSSSASASAAAAATAITALAQSPAIDVLGVGFANGSCVLFDVRMGESLGRVRLDGDGAGQVSCISFRNGSFDPPSLPPRNACSFFFLLGDLEQMTSRKLLPSRRLRAMSPCST